MTLKPTCGGSAVDLSFKRTYLPAEMQASHEVGNVLLTNPWGRWCFTGPLLDVRHRDIKGYGLMAPVCPFFLQPFKMYLHENIVQVGSQTLNIR